MIGTAAYYNRETLKKWAKIGIEKLNDKDESTKEPVKEPEEEQTEEQTEEGGVFEFRPVGFGQQLWEPILTASLEAGAGWVIVEQDEHYDLPSLEAARRSREYLKILGW